MTEVSKQNKRATAQKGGKLYLSDYSEYIDCISCKAKIITAIKMHEDITTNQKAQIFFIYCIGSNLSFPTFSIIYKNATGIIVNIIIALSNKKNSRKINKYARPTPCSLLGQKAINKE